MTITTRIAILARLGTKRAIVTISTMLTADSNKDTKTNESNKHKKSNHKQ